MVAPTLASVFDASSDWWHILNSNHGQLNQVAVIPKVWLEEWCQHLPYALYIILPSTLNLIQKWSMLVIGVGMTIQNLMLPFSGLLSSSWKLQTRYLDGPFGLVVMGRFYLYSLSERNLWGRSRQGSLLASLEPVFGTRCHYEGAFFMVDVIGILTQFLISLKDLLIQKEKESVNQNQSYFS